MGYTGITQLIFTQNKNICSVDQPHPHIFFFFTFLFFVRLEHSLLFFLFFFGLNLGKFCSHDSVPSKIYHHLGDFFFKTSSLLLNWLRAEPFGDFVCTIMSHLQPNERRTRQKKWEKITKMCSSLCAMIYFCSLSSSSSSSTHYWSGTSAIFKFGLGYFW